MYHAGLITQLWTAALMRNSYEWIALSSVHCATTAENGVMTKGLCSGGGLTSSPVYNVEPVTNTSSSSCANNGRRTPRWVLDACRRSSRLCFWHFATRTVDQWPHSRPVCSEARYSSRIAFLAYTPPAFDAPVWGVIPVGLSPSRLAWKTRMAWLPDGGKISKISLFVFKQLTNVTDTHTDTRIDRHRMTA